MQTLPKTCLALSNIIGQKSHKKKVLTTHVLTIGIMKEEKPTHYPAISRDLEMKKEKENHFFSTNGFLSRKRWKRVFFSRCGFSPLFLWNIYTGRERKERRMAEAELEGGGPPRRWGDPKQFHKIRKSIFFTHYWNETRPYVWHSIPYVRARLI